MDIDNFTDQMKFWGGEGGRQYTDRNPHSLPELEELYRRDYGISRRAMNEEFLGDLDRSSFFLEVGAGIGLQLTFLRSMGFKRLLGVEVNRYAVQESKRLFPDIDCIAGSALELPFRDAWFDGVYTSGVLIHIAPQDIPRAIGEIYRVSKRYIWGFEYYTPTPNEVTYHGKQGFLWKQNFPALYLKTFPDLRLVKEKKYTLRGTENVSQMFLLEKIS